MTQPTLTTIFTLNALREAWANAEVPTEDNPNRKGDTLISLLGDELWTVRRAKLSDLDSHLAFRILHRAPEPWAALTDVLGGWLESPTELAKYLHERGVRVVGGDDGE